MSKKNKEKYNDEFDIFSDEDDEYSDDIFYAKDENDAKDDLKNNSHKSIKKVIDEDDDEDDKISKRSYDKSDDKGFSYDDFYKIDKDIKQKKSPKKKEISEEKKKKKAAFWTVFCWSFVALVISFLLIYYNTNLFKKDSSSETEVAKEYDEHFKTIYQYETNSNAEINALISDYYDALVRGDKDKLKEIVVDPDAFGDMVLYEQKAQVISKYSNINCYSLPGFTDDYTLVFATSYISIKEVSSTPLDIKRFYIKKTEDGYKIDNGVLDAEVLEYIELQTNSKDIQDLYKTVQNNVKQCIAEDSAFANFYNKINSN